MSTPSEEGQSRSDFPRDAEQARVDLELTRQELGETVQELAHKMNVPERAKEQAQHAAGSLQEKVPPPVAAGAGQLAAIVRQYPVPAAGAFVVLLLLVRKLARGRKAS